MLAVGNPFQLSSTVTAGIVSAVGRSNIGLADYEDFIQTDAAINPGNSGGALVNLDGEVVGINTAIASRSGGNQGVGFAIPVNMASRIMDSLITTGKVVRGWLGVSIQNINDATAEVFGMDRPHGALVGQVESGSPAEKAGIKQGDVIVSIDGKPVKDVEDLQLKVVDIAPGTKIDLDIMRGRHEMTLPLKLGTLPDKTDSKPDESVSPDEGQDNAETAQPSSDLGLSLENLTQQARRELDLPGNIDGVLVSDVDASKPAGTAGLQRGDIIEKVDDTPVRSVRSFADAIREVPKGKPALLLVRRGDAELFLAIRMPK